MLGYMPLSYDDARLASSQAGRLQPSYTPIQPDAYSDYADDDCGSCGSIDRRATEASGSYTLYGEDEPTCEELLEFWENAWCGNTSRPFHRSISNSKSMTQTAEQLSSHYCATSSIASLPGSPRAFFPDNPSPLESSPTPTFSPDVHRPPLSRYTDAMDPHAMMQPSHSVNSQTFLELGFDSNLSCQQSWEELAVQDTGSGNSWKERKFELPLPSQHPRQPLLSSTLPTPVPMPKAPIPIRANHRTTTSEDEEEAVMAAAWKWRFCRRWKAEQVRAIDPKQASGGGDEMSKAIAYLNAVGDNNHFTRTTSSEAPDLELTKHSGSTYGTSSILGSELFAEESYSVSKQNLLANAVKREKPVRELPAVAKRAHQLLEQQQQVARLVDERWKGAFNSEIKPWAGDCIDALKIDDWGKYRFVMMRTKDKDGRQKLFIRGRNYCTEDVLVAEAKKEVAQVVDQQSLPKVTVELQGSGVMEWRRDRDRHLEIHTPHVYHIPGSNMQPRDFVRLVGVLTKQHLPMHYKVSGEGCAF